MFLDGYSHITELVDPSVCVSKIIREIEDYTGTLVVVGR